MAHVETPPPAYAPPMLTKPTAPPIEKPGEPAVGTPIALDGSGPSGRDPKEELEFLSQRLIDALDIEYEIASDLAGLRGAELVIIADDSGSMGSRSTMRGVPEVKTRWHEL